MNVVVDYPEDFPLVGVDRKVFDHQLRHLFAQPDPYAAHTLDKLRERIGLKSRYHSSDYDELDTLFTLVRTDPDEAVRDQLLVRAGDFLLVHLRRAEFPDRSEVGHSTSVSGTSASGARVSARWIIAGAAVFIATAVATFYWIAPAVASYVDSIIGPSTKSRTPVPLDEAVAPPASSSSADVVRSKVLLAQTASPLSDDGTAELTLSTWTRDPLKAVDGIKRLMPKADGREYQIDVTVSRTSLPQAPTNAGGNQK
ncbi:hypothetical protein QZM82_31915 [Burkholderia cepacia]|uniref:hypothetical protein n=1 Tax=Burkholderia cepacia TaxID=292 RepID=UPI00264B1F08|nr:hypothetical protein [Burkholderia cepacia]MDN7900807.1 hypothetical protein [Burkholderia cepacia]